MPWLHLLGEFIYFLSAIYIVFYLPGKLALKITRINLNFPGNVFLPIFSGSILFTLLIYILLWFNAQFIIYIIIGLVLYFSYRKNLLKLPGLPKGQRVIVGLLILSSVVFSLQMIFDGNFGNTMYTFGDDIVHLAYIAEIKQEFPPQLPGFAGVSLRGYHFFYDFLIATFSNVTHLSHLSLYFHFMPLFTSFGWAFGTYTLIYLWTKNNVSALWAVFFVLFGSSFGYLLNFFGKSVPLTQNLGINQPNMALLNFPYSFSVVIVLAALSLMNLYLYSKQKNIVLLLIIAVFVGIASIFKIYAGMLLIGGFSVFCIFELLRKNKQIVVGGILSLMVFLITFGVFSGSGAGLFYLPYWPIERMFDGIFPEYNVKEKIQTYSSLGVIRGLVETYLYTYSVFLFGNLGTRLVGIGFLLILGIKSKIFLSRFAVIVLVMLVISITIPMLFAQTINVFDMIQLTWYYPLFVSLFAAIGMGFLYSSRIPKIIVYLLSGIIVISSMPLWWVTLQQSFSMLVVERPVMNNDYYESMEYLKTHGTYEDIVLRLPSNLKDSTFMEVSNWYKVEQADIVAWGNKRMFVGNQMVVFPNMPLASRLQFIAKIYKDINFAKTENDVEKIADSLSSQKIKYLIASHEIPILTKSKEFKRVFKNNTSVIYELK